MAMSNSQNSAAIQLLLLLVSAASIAAFPTADVDPGDLIQPLIIGGSNAANGQHPSMVSLQTLAQRHFCGGVIVNTRWALTAAHCVDDRDPFNIRVRSGSLRHSQGGRLSAVQDVQVHHLYEPSNRYNDIAALQIVGNFPQDKLTRPIVIDSRSTLGRVGAVAIGWGRTEMHQNRLAPVLQQVRTAVLSDWDCQQQADIRVDTHVQICALAGFGRGICAGDTGSPLIADGRLIGLSSSAVPCAQGIPDVYTRVSEFHGWITATVGPVRRA